MPQSKPSDDGNRPAIPAPHPLLPLASSCASTTQIAAMLTMSVTSTPLLQHVDGLAHAEQDRPDRLGVRPAARSACRRCWRTASSGKIRTFAGPGQAAPGVGLAQDLLEHRGVGLHLAVDLELRVERAARSPPPGAPSAPTGACSSRSSRTRAWPPAARRRSGARTRRSSSAISARSSGSGSMLTVVSARKNSRSCRIST